MDFIFIDGTWTREDLLQSFIHDFIGWTVDNSYTFKGKNSIFSTPSRRQEMGIQSLQTISL